MSEQLVYLRPYKDYRGEPSNEWINLVDRRFTALRWLKSQRQRSVDFGRPRLVFSRHQQSG
jgi:hypothetical protein